MFVFLFVGRGQLTVLIREFHCWWTACFESRRWKCLCFCCHHTGCWRLDLRTYSGLTSGLAIMFGRDTCYYVWKCMQCLEFMLLFVCRCTAVVCCNKYKQWTATGRLQDCYTASDGTLSHYIQCRYADVWRERQLGSETIEIQIY
jgi:hypothetical protein